MPQALVKPAFCVLLVRTFQVRTPKGALAELTMAQARLHQIRLNQFKVTN